MLLAHPPWCEAPQWSCCGRARGARGGLPVGWGPVGGAHSFRRPPFPSSSARKEGGKSKVRGVAPRRAGGRSLCGVAVVVTSRPRRCLSRRLRAAPHEVSLVNTHGDGFFDRTGATSNLNCGRAPGADIVWQRFGGGEEGGACFRRSRRMGTTSVLASPEVGGTEKFRGSSPNDMPAGK
jgi:hypothetical protein